MNGFLRKMSRKISAKNQFIKSFPLFFGLISGFSVFYFLYAFGAYGIQKGLSYSGHSLLFRSVSFGVLTFTYLTIFEATIKSKLKITSFKHELVWYTALILLGSHLIFILFNYFWNWQELNVEAYLLIIKEFPLMMVFPLFFYIGLKTIIKTRNHEDNYLLIQSENGKDNLKIRLRDFLYAKASENYITILYMSNKQPKKHLIRKRLKVFEKELNAFPDIMRCHRSYLVNRLNIGSIKQSKSKLHIEMGSDSIPISKQYKDSFLL